MNRSLLRTTIPALLLISAPALPGRCQLPDTVPQGFGVNIHFTDPAPGEMTRFAEGGFGFARMDLFWNKVETKRGEYDFSAYDRLVTELQKVGTRALFILDYGNDLYQEGSPRTSESRAAFARFAAAAAKHFADKKVIWEIWNEPNGGQFWRPEPNAAEYASLALETAKTIHKADPSALVLAPGAAGFPWEFLETIFQAGLLEQIDGVSVHPYRTQEPETAAADFARLRTLIARYASPAKRTLPIISSEWGYSTVESSGITEEKQALYLTRMWLANLASGVNLSIFYDWRNDGPDPKENEHNFGTVRPDFAPKPSFLAAKALISELRGYTFRHRLAGKTPSEWRLLFQKDNSKELAVVSWDADPNAETGQALKIHIVEATHPDFNAFYSLASIRFPYGALTEGMQQYASLPVSSYNGETQAAKVQVTLRAQNNQTASVPHTLTVQPGKMGHATLSLPSSPARSDIGPVNVELIWNGEPLPPLAPLLVKRTDPLLLTVAPNAKELTVTVTNPAQTRFKGKVWLVKNGNFVADKGVEMGWRGFGILASQPKRLPQIPGDENPGIGFDPRALTLKPSLPLDQSTVKLPLTLDEPLAVHLLDEQGQLMASLPPRRYVPMKQLVGQPDATANWSRVDFIENKNQTPAPLTYVTAPDKSPAPVALKFDYNFNKGWHYAQATPLKSEPMPEKATALVLWVRSDGSGDHLRSRFKDSTGQTFQVDLKKLDWRGWQALTIPLDGSGVGASWGGANDKIPHAPLTWDGLILVDSANTEKAHGGTVLLAAPTYVVE